jgi:hypothetical protein
MSSTTRTPTIRRRAAAGLLLGLAVLASCSQPERQAQTTMAQHYTDEATAIYMGRFWLAVPPVLALSGESFVVHNVGIEVEDWPQEPGTVYERLWQERMQEIRATRNVDRRTFAEILEEGELVPGVRVVVYQNPSRAEGNLSADALLHVDDRAIWLSTTQRKTPEELKALFRSILSSMRNVELQPGLKREPGQFFLRTHALQLPPDPDAGFEAVTIHFGGSLREGGRVGEKIELSIEIRRTGNPSPETRLDRHRGTMAWLQRLGMRQRTIRAGTRVVAGMAGDELIVRMREEDGELLSFEWEFNGEAGSVVKPKTLILMTGSPREQRALTALWDAILDSIEPVP